MVDDAAGLAWIVNLGCIELHPHPVRAGDLDHPDELRIDLDPTPGVAWADVRRVAMEVKALLEELGLRGWPKTSGSRGMHVNVAHPAALDLHRGAARGAGVLARDRAARAGARDLEVVEGGAPRRVPRLQPERQGPHDLLGLFGAAAARRARLGAARLGRGARLRRRPTSRCSRCRSASPTIGDPHADMDEARRLAREAARAGRARRGRGPRRRALAAALPQDGRRGAARGALARQRRRARSRQAKPRANRMPLLVVANSPDKDAALAGLERWKAQASRGGARISPSTTCWSIRCAAARRPGRASASTCATSPKPIRPPQETPDPDDDPTREWREKWRSRTAREDAEASSPEAAIEGAQLAVRSARADPNGPAAKISASSCGGTTSSWAKVQSRGLLVGAPAPELRRVAEAAALHVVVGDLDHQLGPQRLPREILALAPAARRAGHAAAPRASLPRPRPSPSTDDPRARRSR